MSSTPCGKILRTPTTIILYYNTSYRLTRRRRIIQDIEKSEPLSPLPTLASSTWLWRPCCDLCVDANLHPRRFMLEKFFFLFFSRTLRRHYYYNYQTAATDVEIRTKTIDTPRRLRRTDDGTNHTCRLVPAVYLSFSSFFGPSSPSHH